MKTLETVLNPENYDEVNEKIGTLHVFGKDFHWLRWQKVANKYLKINKGFKISTVKRITIQKNQV
jgi:hypothetical protein